MFFCPQEPQTHCDLHKTCLSIASKHMSIWVAFSFALCWSWCVRMRTLLLPVYIGIGLVLLAWLVNTLKFDWIHTFWNYEQKRVFLLFFIFLHVVPLNDLHLPLFFSAVHSPIRTDRFWVANQHLKTTEKKHQLRHWHSHI